MPMFAKPGKFESDFRRSAAEFVGWVAGIGVETEGVARPAARSASIKALAFDGGGRALAVGYAFWGVGGSC